MTVFARNVQRGTLSHFPSLRGFQEAHYQINDKHLQSSQCKLRFCDFSKEKKTHYASLLNIIALKGVSQKADIAGKDVWASTFRGLTGDLEDVARQKAIIAQKHKWSDTENLPNQTVIFENLGFCSDTNRIMTSSFHPTCNCL